MVMGMLIWTRWPHSGHWFIYLCLSVDMILNGYSLVSAGVSRTTTGRLAWYSLIGRTDAGSSSGRGGATTPRPPDDEASRA